MHWVQIDWKLWEYYFSSISACAWKQKLCSYLLQDGGEKWAAERDTQRAQFNELSAAGKLILDIKRQYIKRAWALY